MRGSTDNSMRSCKGSWVHSSVFTESFPPNTHTHNHTHTHTHTPPPPRTRRHVLPPLGVPGKHEGQERLNRVDQEGRAAFLMAAAQACSSRRRSAELQRGQQLLGLGEGWQLTPPPPLPPGLQQLVASCVCKESRCLITRRVARACPRPWMDPLISSASPPTHDVVELRLPVAWVGEAADNAPHSRRRWRGHALVCRRIKGGQQQANEGLCSKLKH